ncbi:serine/threonine protein phosphatase [Agromyces rhizosphaerae]|uniref:Serine/threonine protein phosphatase n=1 Tax=Agromyces rhizosphaerae TaxID=88374 RepID=A0A9W6D0G1_9MICO|nr:protein phosphatase 2C domain-containing protein [Agromyces rhizosphaerae]GLI28614.1 serine/threonine protein phosphatase [Agromyces rhizosphaerae]
MAVNGERELATAHGPVRVRYGAMTHVGAVRRVNEDDLFARPPVFLVADGMGGHARGDAASRTVVETFTAHIASDETSTPERILDAIATANRAVRALTPGDEGVAMAGTTVSGVALVDAGGASGVNWMAFNVGDSRVYSWNGRTLEQVTVDHSAVQELIDSGLLPAEEAEAHPDRNVITRAIGADESVEIDAWLIPVAGRQSYLICSDGLSKEVPDAEMADVLATAPGPHEVAQRLVDAALAHGGSDNITVLVVESHAEGEEDDPEATRDRVDTSAIDISRFEDTRPREEDRRASLPA